ncbi:ABC transporter ATP-binding protein, partial [bacterium]
LVMVTHDPTMLERADRIVRIIDGRLAPPSPGEMGGEPAPHEVSA